MDTRSKPLIEEFRALPCADLIARYGRGVENFDRRMFLLSEEQLDTAFLPDAGLGRWPVRVLLGHLADAEIAFVHRMRRIAAEDGPVFAAWDENAFIDSGLYRRAENGPDATGEPIAAYVAVIHTLRRWMTPWLAALPEDAWLRKGLHPERGEQTLRTVLEYAAWHVEHHAWFLRAKLDRLVGRWQPEGPAEMR